MLLTSKVTGNMIIYKCDSCEHNWNIKKYVLLYGCYNYILKLNSKKAKIYRICCKWNF